MVLDDPGATTSISLNGNVFSEYTGFALRWVESGNQIVLDAFEDSIEFQLNGYDSSPSYAYDMGLKILQDGNGTQFQSVNYKTGPFSYATWLQVQGNDKPSFKRGMNVTGSIAQEPSAITISAATASIDFSQSNIQTLTLAGGVATHLIPINMSPGQSVIVEITQDGASAGTVTIDGTMSFPGGTPYAATTTLGGKDVLTLVSFDGINARSVGQNDFS